jgi:hypothetical protein
MSQGARRVKVDDGVVRRRTAPSTPPARAAEVSRPDAHRVGDVRRQGGIAEGEEDRKGDQAAPAGHPVEDAGDQSGEKDQDDMRVVEIDEVVRQRRHAGPA